MNRCTGVPPGQLTTGKMFAALLAYQAERAGWQGLNFGLEKAATQEGDNRAENTP